jgi:hypothetical protein
MGEELEDAYAVAETVKSAGFQAAAHTRSNAPVRGHVSADALTGGQGRTEHPILVKISAWGGTPQAAVAAGQGALDELLARHKERFAQAVDGYRQYEKILAAAAEPAGGAPADATARRDLGELRARLASPIVTAETRLVDPFPVPSAPVARNTASSAGIAFAVAAAILTLLVLALGQVGSRGPEDTEIGPRATDHGSPT